MGIQKYVELLPVQDMFKKAIAKFIGQYLQNYKVWNGKCGQIRENKKWLQIIFYWHISQLQLSLTR